MTTPESIHTAGPVLFRRRRCPGRQHMLLAGLIASLTATAPAFGDGKSLVRITDGSQEYTGRIVALNPALCTLMDRQGRLIELDVAKLESVEHLAERFRPDSASTFRSQLTQQFGKQYEVSGTTHYMVCARKGRAAGYAQLFERIYREMEQFYRVRGLRMRAPDVPLVAIVFSEQSEFSKYCLRDNVAPTAGLKGYYSLVTNRVALFADAAEFVSAADDLQRTSDIAALFGIAGQAANTIIHETIHQVSYNVGIHSRLGESPLWVVEGLATVLEPSSMRSRRQNQSSAHRVNPERFNWFQKQYLPSRTPGHLSLLIASDDAFRTQTLNAYSEAWALTFFLLENSVRRRHFADYLQRLSERDASADYTAEQRLSDFQAKFGDVARLEIEFLRFMDRI